MKIVAIALPEMGHFIPVLHIAEELASRGHEVSVLTAEYGKEKCTPMIESAGCTAVFTQDGMDSVTLLPDEKKINNQTTDERYQKFTPFLENELSKLKPDIAVIDFFTVSGLDACDNLSIPVVVNYPLPLLLAGFMNYWPDSKC